MHILHHMLMEVKIKPDIAFKAVADLMYNMRNKEQGVAVDRIKRILRGTLAPEPEAIAPLVHVFETHHSPCNCQEYSESKDWPAWDGNTNLKPRRARTEIKEGYVPDDEYEPWVDTAPMEGFNVPRFVIPIRRFLRDKRVWIAQVALTAVVACIGFVLFSVFFWHPSPQGASHYPY